MNIQNEMKNILETLKERLITPEIALKKIREINQKDSKKEINIYSEINAQTICSIVSSIVGFPLTTESLKMNFVSLGVDSIFAARIMEQLKNRFDLNLSPPAIFEFSNLQDFSDHVLRLVKQKSLRAFEQIKNQAEKKETKRFFQKSDETHFDHLWNSCSKNCSRPPLIFLSGLGCKGEMLSKIIDGFSANYKTFLYVPPGHSENNNSPLEKIEDLIGNFYQFIAENGITTPFHLVGWSLGGIIGQYFAAKYPEKIESLSIVCSSVKPLQESPLFSRSFEEFSFLKEQNVFIPDDLFITLSAEYLKFYKNTLSYFDCTNLNSKISCPIQIINVENDRIMHLKHHHELEKHYPEKHISTIKGHDIGHFGIYTHSDLFINELNKFIGRNDAAVF